MKVGMRESLREANTLYRHPNHNIYVIWSGPLPRASDVYMYHTIRSVGVYGVRKEDYCNVSILFLGFPVLYHIYVLN